MPSTLYSIRRYTATGAAQALPVPPYLDKAHIEVYVNGSRDTSWSWLTNSTISVAAPSGATIVISRSTSPGARVVDFTSGVPLTEEDLDADSVQALYLGQELADAALAAIRAPEGEQVVTLPPAPSRVGLLLGFDSTGSPVTVAPSSGSGVELALNLTSTTDAFRGAGQLGFNPTLGYPDGSAGARLREELTTTGFPSLQAAVNAAAGKRLVVVGTHNITAPVLLPDYITLDFAPGALVQTSTPDISMLKAVNRVGVEVNRPVLVQTAAGSAAYTAGVHLDGCTSCVVRGGSFTGMQWAGVYLNNSSNCVVVGNRFSGALGAVQDSADICVYRNSSDNRIQDNYCYGGGDVGVLIQDPYANSFPARNVVRGNYINGARGYGICVYQPALANTHTLVEGNVIENILGSVAGGSKGAGIYVVGAGGTQVRGNTVRNCCQQTANRTLVPGGIGVSGINDPLTPVSVEGNTVSDVAFYDCITVSSCTAGVLIRGNTLVMAASNTTGVPVYLTNVSDVQVLSNAIRQDSATGSRGIFVYAKSANVSNVVVSDNKVRGGSYSQIEVLSAAGYTVTDFTSNGNSLSGGTSTCIPFRLGAGAVIRGTVSGNTITAVSQPAVYQGGCTGVRYTGNSVSTTGTFHVQMQGANTGTVWDRSNSAGGSALTMNATGTGFLAEFHWTAAPTTGTWTQGSRVLNTSPTVGSPKGWTCSTAGTPGVWTSEGNL